MKKGTCKIIGDEMKDHHFMETKIDLSLYKTKNKVLHNLIFGNKEKEKK